MNKEILPKFLLGLCAASGLSISDLALAADDTKIKSLDKVVVNARYWDESADKVPESLTVIEGSELDKHGLVLLETKIPNITIERSSVQTRIVSRGVSGIDTGLQDPLAYYVNGVALPQGGNQLPQLVDIDQLEFLKGPQGSLYGRNSEAGLLKITTSAPSFTPQFSASLSTSLVDGADGNAPGNIASVRASDALIDKSLAGSIAVRVEDSQGAYHNLAEGHNDGGEVKSWTISTGLRFDSQVSTLIDFRSLIEQKDTGKSRMRFNSGNFATDRFTTHYNSATFDDSKSAIHSLKIEHAFEGFDFTSTTGYTDYHREFQADLDSFTLPSPETLMNMNDAMASQELRLSSNGEGSWRWLMGVYVFRQTTDIDFRIGAPRATRITDIDHNGAALFGQLEFLFTDKLALTLGTRVEESRQTGAQGYALMNITARYEADVNATQHLPKVTLDYTLSDKSIAYLSLAKGYLPGGYNYAFANKVNNFTYEPEASDNLELGYKVKNERLSLNVAAFFINTQDKQIVDVEPGNVQRISNAAETQSYGVELALDYQFTSVISGYATLGTQRATANEYVRNVVVGGALASINLADNELPMAPSETYAFGLKYRTSPTGLFGRIGVNGASRYYFDSFNKIEQPDYKKLEAEVGYQFKKVNVSLAGMNLTDEEIYSRAINLPTGVLVEDASPRTITLNISANW